MPSSGDPATMGRQNQAEGSEQDSCDEDHVDAEGQPSPTGDGNYATLGNDGPQTSAGSTGHPDSCMPCTFYCFTRRGCNRGVECRFCHLSHQSKLQQRRETWKKQQREKRKMIRERVAVEGQARKTSNEKTNDADAPSPNANGHAVPTNHLTSSLPRGGNAGMANSQYVRGPTDGLYGESPSGVAAVFSYSPKQLLMTLGQHVEFQPSVAVMATQFRLTTTLPQGLSLDPASGIISGAPVAASPKTTIFVEADLVDDRTVRTSLELEVIDFTRGGFVVGHMSEIEPGRYMLLMHVPEEYPVNAVDAGVCSPYR